MLGLAAIEVLGMMGGCQILDLEAAGWQWASGSVLLHLCDWGLLESPLRLDPYFLT